MIVHIGFSYFYNGKKFSNLQYNISYTYTITVLFIIVQKCGPDFEKKHLSLLLKINCFYDKLYLFLFNTDGTQ